MLVGRPRIVTNSRITRAVFVHSSHSWTAGTILRTVSHAAGGTTAPTGENPSHGSRRSPDRRPARSGDRAKPEAISRAVTQAGRGATAHENAMLSGFTSQHSRRRDPSEASPSCGHRFPSTWLRACPELVEGAGFAGVAPQRYSRGQPAHAKRDSPWHFQGSFSCRGRRHGPCG